MAYGKNKGLAKGGKKGMKKKQVDPFTKKVWYDVKCPSYIAKGKGARAGRTMVTKTQGMKVETDGLKGRVCEFNLADLKESEDSHKKIKLEVQEIQGKSCLTDFHGLSLTRDRMCNLVKKKHTLVDTWADCKTTDGFVVRIFCIAFTKKSETQVKLLTYAQTSQIRKIRKKIVQVLQTEVASGQLKDMVSKLCVDSLETSLKTATHRIFPLDPVHIYKVKIVKKPKVDITKLWEIHDKEEETGVSVDNQKDEAVEAQNLLK